MMPGSAFWFAPLVITLLVPLPVYVCRPVPAYIQLLASETRNGRSFATPWSITPPIWFSGRDGERSFHSKVVEPGSAFLSLWIRRFATPAAFGAHVVR